jgi:hypothetical protein
MTATLDRPDTTETEAARLSVLVATRPADRDRTAAFIRSGRIVGASFASVYGLVGDGLRPSLGYEIALIKGRAQLGRKLSVCLPSNRLSEMIDLAHVHPSLRTWALDGDALAWTVSSRCYLRVPVRESIAAALPPHLISYRDGVPYLQSLDPNGMPGVNEFMTTLWQTGVPFPAVTSMNLSGDGEIVEFAAAVRFAEAAGLPALMLGPNQPRSTGSRSILELGPSGLLWARPGTFSLEALQRQITAPIITRP